MLAGQDDVNVTDMDITIFIAAAADSLSWIENGFPIPLPYNGTVCHQVSGMGISAGIVSEASAELGNLVSHHQ